MKKPDRRQLSIKRRQVSALTALIEAKKEHLIFEEGRLQGLEDARQVLRADLVEAASS